jgi:predicted nucleotidyltransferase
VNARIAIPTEQVAEFCQRNQILRLALFGSVLRDDFTPESDVDILVEIEPDARIGFAFITIQDELSGILGRQVDLHTFRGIESNRNWLLREEILGSAEAVYGQTG